MSAKPPLLAHADGLKRCAWCGEDPLYVRYHDEEWGVPEHDSRRLFEMLCLEGAQAGLSWITVLRKRDSYRRAFHHFDPAKMARITPARVGKLLLDPGIVRNRLKVEGFVKNAKAWLELEGQGGGFAPFVWQFAPAKHRRPGGWKDARASTPESDAMSKALRRAGFTFVGSTICYAFMQAVGIVDDHMTGCWAAGRAAKIPRHGSPQGRPAS